MTLPLYQQPSKSTPVARTSLCHLPLLMVVSRVALPHGLVRYSTPRSITPRPDSFLPPPRPIARLHPRRPQSTFPSLHVFSTWQCAAAAAAAAIAIQTLEASHSYTCCAYTTHAPVSPHTRTRISMHACSHPDMPHLPYRERLTQEQRNKHHPSLPRRPVLPLPERMASTRHAYMHASMQNRTRAASRAFQCSLAKTSHHHRRHALPSWFGCDRHLF